MKLTHAQKREIHRNEKLNPRYYEFHEYPGEAEEWSKEQDKMAADTKNYRYDSEEGMYIPRGIK